jgi:hypothetical protein
MVESNFKTGELDLMIGMEVGEEDSKEVTWFV